MQAADILHFWFQELTAKQHFAKDAALDETIRTRFGTTLEAAARCELFAWRATPEGRLAEVLAVAVGLALRPRHAPATVGNGANPGLSTVERNRLARRVDKLEW